MLRSPAGGFDWIGVEPMVLVQPLSHQKPPNRQATIEISPPPNNNSKSSSQNMYVHTYIYIYIYIYMYIHTYDPIRVGRQV